VLFLSPLQGFDFREGTVFSWPSVTGFSLDKEKAGGGVLMDIGIHMLDLLFWWLGDTVSSFQYGDDSCGGLEATVDLRITFSSGIAGRIKLTRLSVLRNFYTLEFERGVVFWNPFLPQRIYIKKDQKIASRKMADENSILTMLTDFSDSALKHRLPLIGGREALASLRFIESCYARRQTIPMSWLRSKVS
jgi:predicted dehydrogenase